LLYNKNGKKLQFLGGALMKKRILFIGITMAAAGSEKSFLSFASHAIDYSRYDVDLLLAKREGDFLDQIPKQIRVLEMGDMGEIFLLDKKNAFSTILKYGVIKHPTRAASLLPYIMGRIFSETSEKRIFAAHRIWMKLMALMPEWHDPYDIALAYWGDRTMFYMVDKVKAAKKIAWLHFDYKKPPREDALYERYFSACDRVITVSREIEDSLKKSLPRIAPKVLTVENIMDENEILNAAELPADFEDDFLGIRIVTMGRICDQKGYDLAVPAVVRLRKEGYPIKWYILGKGSPEEERALKEQICQYGAEQSICILGVRKNPYPYIKEADIYMQPSRHEGKPISVEEAKILCKPILVTNYTSASEQLESGKLGMIAEISVEGIYRGLKRLLDDETLRQQYSRNLLKMKKEKTEIFLDDLL
jgi:glycosyltransferase involved in cell wall biosynthesis